MKQQVTDYVSKHRVVVLGLDSVLLPLSVVLLHSYNYNGKTLSVVPAPADSKEGENVPSSADFLAIM